MIRHSSVFYSWAFFAPHLSHPWCAFSRRAFDESGRDAPLCGAVSDNINALEVAGAALAAIPYPATSKKRVEPGRGQSPGFDYTF
ncbi:MAG TPA: hypothetical protein VGO91_11655 [Pyrinomonadaceae bacterium]|jgi:hypothetical protein|nr:hypothetical protein [Pyrinomonadaceae bacterium]